MAEIHDVKAEDMLLGQYLDAAENNDGGLFRHIGLPSDASWGQFRRHYDNNGKPDIDRAVNDLLTYPPVAAHIAEQKRQQKDRVVSLEDHMVSPETDESDS